MSTDMTCTTIVTAAIATSVPGGIKAFQRRKKRLATIGIAKAIANAAKATEILTTNEPAIRSCPPIQKSFFDWSTQIRIAMPLMNPETTTLGTY